MFFSTSCCVVLCCVGVAARLVSARLGGGSLARAADTQTGASLCGHGEGALVHCAAVGDTHTHTHTRSVPRRELHTNASGFFVNFRFPSVVVVF